MGNQDINYFSLDELEFFEAREAFNSPHTDYVPHPEYMKFLAEKADEHDPGGKKAHELAKKYARK